MRYVQVDLELATGLTEEQVRRHYAGVEERASERWRAREPFVYARRTGPERVVLSLTDHAVVDW